MEVKFTGTSKQIKAKISFMDLPDGVYDLTIVDHRAKRSLNANAYLWSLVGKMADILREDKEEVYRTLIERYGQGEVIEIRSGIPAERYFKYCSEIGTVKHDGQEYRQIMVWRGSSEYNTREMAILLDGALNEAYNMGIPTISEEEAAKLKGAWGK